MNIVMGVIAIVAGAVLGKITTMKTVSPEGRATYKGERLPALDFQAIPEATAAVLARDFPLWAYDMAKTPEDALAEAEIGYRLRSVVEGLRPRLRRVIDLVIYDGLNFVEAGKLLGVTHSRCQQLFWQAVALVRKAVSRSEFFPRVIPCEWFPVPREDRAETLTQYTFPIGPMPAFIEYPEVLPARYVEALRMIDRLTVKEVEQIRRHYAQNSGFAMILGPVYLEPAPKPKKLDEIAAIIDQLTEDEERQVRDFIGQCRVKDCESDAGKHGYCQSHHRERFGFGYVIGNKQARTKGLKTYPLTRK